MDLIERVNYFLRTLRYAGYLLIFTSNRSYFFAVMRIAILFFVLI